jgi:hypothetical protein
MLPHDLVAGAGSLSELVAFDQRYLAAMRLDQAVGLKPRRDLRDGRAPHAEHAAQEFVGERNGVATGLVAGLQQPPAEAAGHIVQRIAGRSLLDLPELELRISDDQVAQACALIHGRAKRRRRNGQGDA